MTELTRRDFLARGVAAAGALALTEVPSARAAGGTFDGTIRIVTLGTEFPGAVQSRAEKELGLRISVQYRTNASFEFNRLVRQEPGMMFGLT